MPKGIQQSCDAIAAAAATADDIAQAAASQEGAASSVGEPKGPAPGAWCWLQDCERDAFASSMRSHG